MKKNSFLSRVTEGRGFYIALILCVIAVGIGSWAVLRYTDKTSIAITAQMPDTGEDVFNPQTPIPSAKATPKPDTQTQSLPKSFVWPVSGKVDIAYSVDALIYNPTMSDWRTHYGIDISADLGTKVEAAADGVVESVENGGMLGTTVTIEHDGGLKSVYANLAPVVNVSTGSKVKAGEVLGKVGQTSVSEAGTAPHLHFEMALNGDHVSPLIYLPD